MRPQKATSDPHGTNNRYAAGCSCIECCDAHAEYMRSSRVGRQYVNRRVAAEPTRNRLLSILRVLSLAEVSRRSGLNRWTIRNIRDGRSQAILARTRDAIFGIDTRKGFKRHEFECRNCGHQVLVVDITDHRTVFCSAACERAYWRRVTKKPTKLTVRDAWELEWREARDAS